MLHLVSDTSTLISPATALEQGFHIVPLEVTINDQSFADLEEITTSQLADKIRNGAMPSSSQPRPARKLDLYNELLQNPEDEILDLCIANGLSGTYTSACMMKDQCDDPNRVHVYNTHTLCGPQKAMVETALRMRDEGADAQAIMKQLDHMLESHFSGIMVRDFDFLKRGGRAGSASALVGKVLKLVPVAILNESGESLSVIGTSRTTGKAFAKIKEEIEKKLAPGTGSGYTLYLSHGDDPDLAQKAAAWFAKVWPEAGIEINELCPMFLVHGGPGCLSVQIIKTK